MKKIINIAIFSVFILISFFFTTTKVSANTINSIEMDVYIDNNGNASVTEIWNANLNKGTEGYRPYPDLRESEISDFSVIDETGAKYKRVGFWYVDASFQEKAYKNGIKDISGGVELCWGMSEYGNKTYTLKYKISNFVTQYTDTQGIYFKFFDIGQDIGNVKITIRSDKNFSLENAKIWGFGYNGTNTFEDGKIVLNSNGSLSSSQYMTSLVRFESNLFNTSITSNKSFDDDYDSAMSDAEESELNFLKIFKFFWKIAGYIGISILAFIFNPYTLICILLCVFFIKKVKKTGWFTAPGKASGQLDFGVEGKTLPKDNEINYFREIPCNKDLGRAYWVAYQYDVVPTDTLKEGVIGAILLKWVKDGLITVSKTRKGLFDFKDNNYAIDFSNMQQASNEIENRLLAMLKKASGSNNILEAKEFEKWCKKNHVKIQNWFNSFISLQELELKENGLVEYVLEDVKSIYGTRKITTVHVNPKLKEDAIQLKGLRKFLLDFSMMPEREHFEVHIWEEYLIFAQLLGVADKVEEQFSRLYPNFSELSKLNTKVTTVAIRGMASLGYSGYERAQRAARSSSSSRNYSGSSRSSGGGGSSYSSGGRSARGSSGGGFR